MAILKEYKERQDFLFQSVTYEYGLFGVGADKIYVCIQHGNRVIPCRECMYVKPASIPYRPKVFK